MLVGNKNEDPTKKLVSESEVQDFIEKENLQHIEASAKTGKNVDLVRMKLPSLMSSFCYNTIFVIYFSHLVKFVKSKKKHLNSQLAVEEN